MQAACPRTIALWQFIWRRRLNGFLIYTLTRDSNRQLSLTFALLVTCWLVAETLPSSTAEPFGGCLSVVATGGGVSSKNDLT